MYRVFGHPQRPWHSCLAGKPLPFTLKYSPSAITSTPSPHTSTHYPHHHPTHSHHHPTSHTSTPSPHIHTSTPSPHIPYHHTITPLPTSTPSPHPTHPHHHPTSHTSTPSPHIPQVRSLTLDALKPEWIQRIREVGNKASNAVYEASLPPDFDKGYC